MKDRHQEAATLLCGSARNAYETSRQARHERHERLRSASEEGRRSPSSLAIRASAPSISRHSSARTSNGSFSKVDNITHANLSTPQHWIYLCRALQHSSLTNATCRRTHRPRSWLVGSNSVSTRQQEGRGHPVTGHGVGDGVRSYCTAPRPTGASSTEVFSDPQIKPSQPQISSTWGDSPPFLTTAIKLAGVSLFGWTARENGVGKDQSNRTAATGLS